MSYKMLPKDVRISRRLTEGRSVGWNFHYPADVSPPVKLAVSQDARVHWACLTNP